MSNNRWRLLELDVDSYAEATISLSPAIARTLEEEKVPETLAMYTHRHPSIIMGRQNDPDVDINYDYCQEAGIIVKRIPVPGTIFGHTGYIMNVLHVHRDRIPGAIPDVFATLNKQFAAAFTKEWGVEARHRPINDLEILTDGVWQKVGPFGLVPTCAAAWALPSAPCPMRRWRRPCPARRRNSWIKKPSRSAPGWGPWRSPWAARWRSPRPKR